MIPEFSAIEAVNAYFSTFSFSDITPLNYPYLFVCAFGLILGMSELMTRYRDEPFAIFGSKAAIAYVALNGVLAIFSLYLIGVLGLSFQPESSVTAQSMIEQFSTDVAALKTAAAGSEAMLEKIGKILESVTAFLTPQSRNSAQIYNILLAGFGGAAFFRSSIMRTRVGEKDVSVGPGLVIDTLLGALDREVDRVRAAQRSQRVEDLLGAITLRDAAEIIVPYCIELMQNLTSEERMAIREKLDQAQKDLVSQDDGEEVSPIKPITLCLNVVEFVGFAVLEKAIKTLRALGVMDTFATARRKAQEQEQRQSATFDEIDALQRELARPAGHQGPSDEPPDTGTESSDGGQQSTPEADAATESDTQPPEGDPPKPQG